MGTNFSLTSDFSAASRKHTDDMKYLQELVRTVEGQTFLDTIPVYRPQDWGGHTESNCMSFAFHRDMRERLQPGMIGTGIKIGNKDRPKGLIDYVESVRRSLLSDNIPFLGDNLKDCVGRGVPAALFFLNNPSDEEDRDYHWVALRRTFNSANGKYDTLIWADKLGAKVSCCDPSPFFKVKLSHYNEFGGYYAVPPKLMLPS
ncbi:MAG: hypothetical protein ACK4NR_06420 [Micavibrio sp.]